MTTIAFYETKPWEAAYLKKKLRGYTVKFFEETLSADNVVKGANIVSVFINSPVNADMIKKMPKLKMVTTRSTGFDHIDRKMCKKKGIIVCNVPFYGENTVAEHCFALLLTISRNIHKSYLRTIKDDFSIDGLTGFDLKGKTIGIIGGGHIGLHVARMARGFGMNVLVFDIHRQPFLADTLGFQYAEMDELMKNSDIITIHVPYNPHTHHLINKDNLKLVKKGTILLNTSRGGVVDTDALLEALENKTIGAAGLDVIEGEQLISEERELLHESDNPEKLRTVIRDKEILHMENVVFTPHNAFNSKEALMRILDATLENIDCYSSGKCKNVVK